jgi:alpha-amylase
VFDTDQHYFDDIRNAEICRKVTHKCYLPAGRVLLQLIREHGGGGGGGGFRFAFSFSGVVLDQFEAFAPEVLDLLKELVGTGCVEVLSETYHHSLSFIYSRDEFRRQVEQHRRRVEGLFGVTPRVFRNTELIYNNDVAQVVAHMGYDAILAEGADQALGTRSPNLLYRPPSTNQIKVLVRNYRLSDDVAFRFSNRSWAQWPLTADKFAQWVEQVNGGGGKNVNLFMDFETFGEHQWAETGIFDFLRHMPGKVLASGNTFLTPTQVMERYPSEGDGAGGVIDVPNMTSWADSERDVSAWLGNAMQSNAMHELYKLEQAVKESGDARLLEDWRRLSTSDHCYYMSTKYWSDGEVHKYFNPYESPYDAYINYMNVLDNIASRVGATGRKA